MSTRSVRMLGFYMAKKITKKARKEKADIVERYDNRLGFRSDDDIKKAEKYLGKANAALPLPQSFFLTSILGFLIAAALTISGKLSPSWGFAFCLVFVMMFIASFISMTPRGEGLL